MPAEWMPHLKKRRTFAIISHPDAGKTTLTEKLLLFGGAIQLAGTVKGSKATRHATSDWMALEKQRGISITSSVMQFAYRDHVINLLDTPGHEDFSEDTYRTLTAVDSALMVIDAAKGVEARTIKLLEVCRLRRTPIMTFINKMDRDTRPLIELLDEIETVLAIRCAPITWPIGTGKQFKGVYHLLEDKLYLYDTRCQATRGQIIAGLHNPRLDRLLAPDVVRALREDLHLVTGASYPFEQKAYGQGQLTPVFFGSAMTNGGVRALLDSFVRYAPGPQAYLTTTRTVQPTEKAFSGFVFKVQANMDPQHRDRMAFVRICSGQYTPSIKLQHVPSGRTLPANKALTFMAGDRSQTQQAGPGDIIGLPNHGTIKIGDTFTQGEKLTFKGIPYFAPELFRRVSLNNPLKTKALLKGLQQLSEEGAVQLFSPLLSNRFILGAVGPLQFETVAYRLQYEYNVDCAYAAVTIHTARWVHCADPQMQRDFKHKVAEHVAWDSHHHLTYLAPTRVHLELTEQRWPDIVFLKTREVSA